MNSQSAQAGAGDVVVEALERAVRAELEEALGGAAAVDPRGVAEAVDGVGLGVAAGGEAEREGLVEEGPEEDPAEGEAGGREGVPVRLVARGLLVDGLGEEGVVGAEHRVLRWGRWWSWCPPGCAFDSVTSRIRHAMRVNQGRTSLGQALSSRSSRDLQADGSRCRVASAWQAKTAA